jgi:hypothetical protein
MAFQWLQAKTRSGRMALNAANVVIALSQEYGLYFIPEVFEVQFLSRLLSERNWDEGKRNTE